MNLQFAQQQPDPISPLITFLQQLQGLRQLYSGDGARNSGGLFGFAQQLESGNPVLTSNSIDGSSDVPPTNVNTNRVRPRLIDFLQSSRAANFLERLFRNNNRNDRLTNTFAENLLGLIFNRRTNNVNANTASAAN